MKENDFIFYILGTSILFLILLAIFPSSKETNTANLTTKTVIIENFTSPDVNAVTDATTEVQKMYEILNFNAEKEVKHMKMDNPETSFCWANQSDSSTLESLCNNLSSTNCNLTSCCVYLNFKNKKNICVAGDVNGPTYKTDSTGNLITADRYYYKNKKYMLSGGVNGSSGSSGSGSSSGSGNSGSGSGNTNNNCPCASTPSPSPSPSPTPSPSPSSSLPFGISLPPGVSLPAGISVPSTPSTPSTPSIPSFPALL